MGDSHEPAHLSGLKDLLCFLNVVISNIVQAPFICFRLFGWKHENRAGDFEDEHHENEVNFNPENVRFEKPDPQVTKAVLSSGNILGMSRTEQLRVRCVRVLVLLSQNH